ncbi:MAG TPA: tRNA (N(6)-L-threonylcarbamoyladenosine(37)-C(2))-methylthiotransferase MtaB [Candidatus Aveggerthella excrementigallinarum]|nr:tRNA (N(6)-L-threonylcarbamoyladenosine(37)-C(2))-methylthiotransferase MtaB [Candidatus Aveggerthella excrementigallinarum]
MAPGLRRPQFAVVNLGCKVNRVESDGFQAALAARGFAIAPAAQADVVVVNTCTVTGEAEKKTRKAVRRALRASQDATVVVTGCAAVIDPAEFLEMSSRVVAEPDKTKVVDAALDAIAPDERMLAGYGPARSASAPGAAEASFDPALRVGAAFPTRVGVKVQDGCNNACSYCIVHVARGRAWSRPSAEVVAEAAALARAGVREIVLTGINLGSYRQEGGYRLADLLRELLAATSAEGARFRVSSIEPRDVDDALIDVLAESDGLVCRHLHLPLQAGSASVLREMRRPYDAAFFERLVGRLRERVPGLSLSTDIIAGFPGETDAEFEETLSLARACGFSKIHAFPYSRRAGTPAAARADQVPDHVKAERTARLLELSDALRAADFAGRVGSVERVLVEEGGRGMTESYHEVVVPAGERPGALIPLTLHADMRIEGA